MLIRRTLRVMGALKLRSTDSTGCSATSVKVKLWEAWSSLTTAEVPASPELPCENRACGHRPCGNAACERRACADGAAIPNKRQTISERSSRCAAALAVQQKGNVLGQAVRQAAHRCQHAPCWQGVLSPAHGKASRTARLVEAQASFPDACALVPVHARAGAMRPKLYSASRAPISIVTDWAL